MGIFDSENRLFLKRPGQTVSWTTFINVFAQKFWFAMVGVFVGLSIVFYVIFLNVNRETTIGNRGYRSEQR